MIKRFVQHLALISLLTVSAQSLPNVIYKANASSSNGSISLNGTTDWLTVPASTDWTIDSAQDFTIEWWQYNNSTSSFPRIFSVDSYPSSSIAVSQEGGTFYFWMANGFRASASMSSTNRTWENYAVTRTGGAIRIFKNGTQIGSTVTGNTSAATNSTSPLYIGREENGGNTIFRGYITDFHFVKGTSRYSANYTVTAAPLVAIPNTKLLLNAANASDYLLDSNSSSSPKTLTSFGSPTWNASSPYNSIANLATPSFSLSGTACTTGGRIITITSVPNASSYTARLYTSSDKTTLVSTHSNFVSGSRITGLTASTTYFLTLQAIGDEISYSSSQETDTPISYATNSSSCAPALSAASITSSAQSDTTASLTFSSVSNASSYTLKIYSAASGGSLLRTITNYSSAATIAGLSEQTSYYATLTSIGDVTNYSDSSESTPRFNFTTLSSATAPSAPTLNSVTTGDRRVTIAFTAGATNGAAITDYEYSLNGGSYVSASTTSSPFTITGLSGRTAYSVSIKARNSAGLSTASSSMSATTTDSSVDANEAAAAEATRVAAAADAAKKAKEQKELMEILALIPKIGQLTLSLGETTKSLYSTKCVKGKTTKFVTKGAKCPKGYKKK
jgi:hypothetical protein